MPDFTDKEESLFTVCNMHDETQKIEIGGKNFAVPGRRGSFIVKKGKKHTIWK